MRAKEDDPSHWLDQDEPCAWVGHVIELLNGSPEEAAALGHSGAWDIAFTHEDWRIPNGHYPAVSMIYDREDLRRLMDRLMFEFPSFRRSICSSDRDTPTGHLWSSTYTCATPSLIWDIRLSSDIALFWPDHLSSMNGTRERSSNSIVIMEGSPDTILKVVSIVTKGISHRHCGTTSV
jgi:hypothetical protein